MVLLACGFYVLRLMCISTVVLYFRGSKHNVTVKWIHGLAVGFFFFTSSAALVLSILISVN